VCVYVCGRVALYSLPQLLEGFTALLRLHGSTKALRLYYGSLFQDVLRAHNSLPHGTRVKSNISIKALLRLSQGSLEALLIELLLRTHLEVWEVSRLSGLSYVT
jgi:hypothetical protein